MGVQGRHFLFKASSRLRQARIGGTLHGKVFAGLAILLFCAYMPVLGADLKWHWASSGLISLCGCLLATRLPRPWILPGLMVGFAGLGTVTLLALWHSGLSDGFTLAGLFPYSDAAGYFSDAQRILVGEPITAFSSRRPLYAAFLAGLLKVTGNHLRWTLWLQTLLVSCSIGCVTWGLLKRSRDTFSASVFGMLLWLFFRRFIGTTTTEHLGLLLGAFGFLAIVEAVHDRSIRLFTLGLFTTGLALNARAGAFFVLPSLLVWGSRYFAQNSHRVSWPLLGMGCTAIVLSFCVNYGVLILSGGRPGLAFSNASFTLYGLVHGGNWQLALTQHPELGAVEPQRQAVTVFQLALAQIGTHPFSLIKGAFRAWVSFLPQAFSFVDSPHPFAPISLGGRLVTLLALRGLFTWRRPHSTVTFSLLLAYLAGIILSVPFAPPWDSDYMRIYAATIPALCWLASTGAWLKTSHAPTHPSFNSATVFRGMLMAYSGLLLLFSLPHMPRTSTERMRLSAVPGSTLRIDSGVGSPDSLNSIPNQERWRSWRWLIQEKRFPPIPLNQLLENAHPKISPESARSFLKSLPRENATLFLATGNAWPDSPGHDTRIVVLQESSEWILSDPNSRPLRSVKPSSLP
jgi:hypothetical protein